MKIRFVFIFICSLNLSYGEDYSDLLNDITQKFQEKLKETEKQLELKFQVEIAKKDEQINLKLKDIVRDEIRNYFAENKEMETSDEIQDIEKLSNSVKVINTEKNKELIEVSRNGRIEEVKQLLAEGVDPNWKTQGGMSSIMLASRKGHQEVVKILLNHGADINSTCCNLYGIKDIDILKLLLENGANVNEKPMYGYSTFTWYVEFDQTEKVQVLLDYGADANIRDHNGNTSLMSARSTEMVKILLAGGADVNARNNQGDTSLMYARSADIAQILVASGADVNAKNKKGYTALDFARNRAITELLIQNGTKTEKDIN